jgi:hypothetical protein
MFLPFLTDETVTEARIAGRNLVHEIRDCKTWNMICVTCMRRLGNKFPCSTCFVRISCMDVPTRRTLSTHGAPSFARSSDISAPQRNYVGVQTPVMCVLTVMDSVRTDTVKLWTPHCIPEIPHWHRGRMCLVGDAVLPPNGQGSAMAFEDTAYLVHLCPARRRTGVHTVRAQ